MNIYIALLIVGMMVAGNPFKASAEAPALFSVLVSKGKVEIKGTGEWKPLPSGAKVFAGEVIKVGDNALVSLVNSAGKSLEIKKSGTYQANDLPKLATGGGTLTKRFAGYVAAELTRSNDAANAKDTYKKNMTTTGGVERANDEVIQPVDRTLELAKIKQYQTDDASATTSETFENLVALMPRPTDILDDNIHFSWQPKQGVDSFLLTVRDEKHDVLLSKTTARSHALVSAKALGLEPSKCYFWSVTCMPDESAKTDEYSLCMITNSRKTTILDTVRMIEAEAGKSSVLGKLMIARYFEEESLFSSAFDVYREALALEPESDDVFVAFRRFRARLGLPE